MVEEQHWKGQLKLLSIKHMRPRLIGSPSQVAIANWCRMLVDDKPTSANCITAFGYYVIDNYLREKEKNSNSIASLRIIGSKRVDVITTLMTPS